ncbi:uncharacterized protein [Pyxicephalus adspersus]|uniref:uncharacterized protein n=1 Tax=Pyxicephalus adspersus TaxID=30357 RepID=UPI003B5BDEB2
MRLAATCACLFLMPLALIQSVSNCIINIRRSPCNNLLSFQYQTEDMYFSKKRLLIFQNHFDQLNNSEKICILRKVLELYILVNEDVWTKNISAKVICELHDHLVYFEDNCLKCEACQEIFGNRIQPKKKGCRGIFESKAKPKKKCYQEVIKKKKKRKKNICSKVSQSKIQSNGTQCTEIKQKRSKKNVCKGMFGHKSQFKECRNYNKNMDLNATSIINCQLSRLKLEKKNRPAKVQEKLFFELDILQRFLRSAEETSGLL